jgi:hypothetical protein
VNAVVTSAPYLRSAAALNADDRRDLDAYFEHLRAYFDIPADRPVFPARPSTSKKSSHPSSRRAPAQATGRNRGDHPWRNTL